MNLSPYAMFCLYNAYHRNQEHCYDRITNPASKKLSRIQESLECLKSFKNGIDVIGPSILQKGSTTANPKFL